MNKFFIKTSNKSLNKKLKILSLFIVNLVLISCFLIICIVYGLLLWNEIVYSYNLVFNDEVKNSTTLSRDLPKRVTIGEDILLKPVIKIPEPEDKDFSIIIPKINVNKKVIPNVDITNNKEVKEALSKGVWWAKGTVEPGEFGNSLIFSHSSSNIWDIWQYNSIFSLLDKLVLDDMFSVVYKGRQYDFIVFEKKLFLLMIHHI